MEVTFTAAVERALVEAAAWSTANASEELEAPSLLLGLLAEPECRAAIMLARCGIDPAAVHLRWPGLSRSEGRVPARAEPETPPRPAAQSGAPVRRFSREVQTSLAAASRRLLGHLEPAFLATEHVLFGLAVAGHDVGRWLRERGLDPDTIEAEIRQLYSHSRQRLSNEMGSPVDFPADESQQSPGVATPGLCSTDRMRILRVIDAAANRAQEGLRVVEDYVRFGLDDRHLTEQCKHLRHGLGAVLAGVSFQERLAARETQADVGTTLTTPTEQSRRDMADVLAANFSRLQESLRSLEEFGKTLDPAAAARLEQLRYQSYTLQRAVEITRASLQKLAGVRLYVLLDGRANLDEFVAMARSLIGAGAQMIQLRDKKLDDRRLLERARALREATRAVGVPFIMNDRPDLAVLAGTDGVHVGQEEVSVKDARTIVGPDALVGVSTHSIEQARQAVLDGANYIGVGPMFPSETKQFDQFPGLELLRAVAAEIRLPAFAIGGIGPENVAEVLQTGIRRIAVSGAVLDAPDPAAAARVLSKHLTAQPWPT